MELNDIYNISDALLEKIEKGELRKKTLDNLTITISVTPRILYGIDKEFYRITHDGETEGFKHQKEVEATINGVKFKITPQEIPSL